LITLPIIFEGESEATTVQMFGKCLAIEASKVHGGLEME
jgi:hypothetical protein